MSKVLVAFSNCMNVPNDPNAMPAFYETFIEGMRKNGNIVKFFSHRAFGVEKFPSIETDPKTLSMIKEFAPDICFLFNNCFYDISDVVDCPIVVYEVDSPNYYTNAEVLKIKKDRFLHFIFQSSSRDYLKKVFEIEDKYIFDIPFFTEIRANNCEFERNIGFIGSNFVDSERSPTRFVNSKSPSVRDRLLYFKLLEIIENDPNCDIAVVQTIIDAFESDDLKFHSALRIKQMIMQELSGEKRIRLLGVLTPLGLEIFGTENWVSQYYANTALARAYNPTRIYSKTQNEYIYNTSRIGINVSHLQAVTGFPWRIMDILASNACLVTDYHQEFERVFGDIADIIPTYENPGDAYAVCKGLLSDEERRREIVLACQQFVDERYRFQNCLKLIEQYSGVTLHK